MENRGDAVRVLHVDDDAAFASTTATFLERESERFDVETAPSGAAALDRLADAEYDCVVSDYQMPGRNGLELLRAVRADDPDLPFLLFTGEGSESIASEAISAGVTDYLRKGTGTDQYALLANKIENAVERHRTERELRRRERSLARAQRIASLGSWDLDVETGELRWSDQIYRIFGVEPDEFEGTYETFLGFVHPDDRDAVRAAVDGALTGDGEYRIDHRIVRPDGTERLVHERAEVRYENGEPVSMSGIVQDITERRRRERELRESRRTYQQLFDSITDMVLVHDVDGRFLEINETSRDRLGYDCEEIDDLTIEDLHPSEVDVGREEIQEQFAGGSATFESVFLTADGEEIPVDVSATTIDYYGERAVLAVARDVTERNARKRELERSRDLLAKTEQLTDAGGWEYDPAADSLRWTDGIRRLHDVPPDYEPTLEAAIDFYHGEDAARIDALVQRALEDGRAFDEVLRIETAEGRQKWLRVVGDPYLEDGAAALLRGAVQDVTERVERERELEQTTEELAVLNRVVRHDIRNDMTVALGWLELVGDHVDDEGADALARAVDAGRNVVELTEIARDYVRLIVDEEQPDLEAVDLQRVVEDVLTRRRELYPDVDFTVDVPPVTVAANKMLSSVFTNALNNAVQHNDRERPAVSVTAEVSDDVVQVRVADDGPGIPDERKEQVFGRNEEGLDSVGTGIGLYLVDSLVTKFGGDVWVEDNQPRGAVLVVELERYDDR
jgi:PAS domain S-box-containing protein